MLIEKVQQTNIIAGPNLIGIYFSEKSEEWLC